jgi:hypothetical protein
MKFNEIIVFFKVKLQVEAVPMLQQDDLQIPMVLNVLVVIERLLLSHFLIFYIAAFVKIWIHRALTP